MSKTANWSYTSIATIYPMVFDSWKSVWMTSGDPYLVDCTWKAENKIAENKVDVANVGKELSTLLTFYTEMKRNGEAVMVPKRDWYIATGDMTAISDPVKADARIIRTVTEEDMSPFGEEPDFKIMT